MGASGGVPMCVITAGSCTGPRGDSRVSRRLGYTFSARLQRRNDVH